MMTSKPRVYDTSEIWQKYCTSDEQLPSKLISLNHYQALLEKAEKMAEAFSKIRLSHDFDCAIAVNGRHECSCGFIEAKQALKQWKEFKK